MTNHEPQTSERLKQYQIPSLTVQSRSLQTLVPALIKSFGLCICSRCWAVWLCTTGHTNYWHTLVNIFVGPAKLVASFINPQLLEKVTCIPIKSIQNRIDRITSWGKWCDKFVWWSNKTLYVIHTFRPGKHLSTDKDEQTAQYLFGGSWWRDEDG